jgi:rhodanese-related sulfurtransferase
MPNYDLEQAKAFFAAKVAFTTGTHEVSGMIERGDDVVVVDVRLPSDFRQGHIPGAINLPNGKWHKTEGLSRDKTNVLYCYSQTCHLAALAAVELASQGYPVVEMEGGFATWEAGGYAVESAQAQTAAVS